MKTTYDLAREQAATPSAALITAMVAQKNAVMTLINQNDDDTLIRAKGMLDLFHPLWVLQGYGYKGRELYRLIREAARKLQSSHEGILSTYRRGTSSRRLCELSISKMEQLSKEC